MTKYNLNDDIICVLKFETKLPIFEICVKTIFIYLGLLERLMCQISQEVPLICCNFCI